MEEADYIVKHTFAYYTDLAPGEQCACPRRVCVCVMR